MDDAGRGHGAFRGQAGAQMADRGVGDVEDLLGLDRILPGPVAEDHVDDLHEGGRAQGIEEDHGRGDDAHQLHGAAEGMGQGQDHAHVHGFPGQGQPCGPAPVHAAFLQVEGQKAGGRAFEHGRRSARHGAESADVDQDAVPTCDESEAMPTTGPPKRPP
jgi:hypothetical protein